LFGYGQPSLYFLLQSRIAVQFPGWQMKRLPISIHPRPHRLPLIHARAAAISGNPVPVIGGHGLVPACTTTTSRSAEPLDFVRLAIGIAFQAH